MKLKQLAVAAAIALTALTTLSVAPANATPRILLVLAKLESRATSREDGFVSHRFLRELEDIDTCPSCATVVTEDR